jgi:hypothetical protein
LLGVDPPREPPLIPLIGPYGWPILDPQMFIPPWYPRITTQLVEDEIKKMCY